MTNGQMDIVAMAKTRAYMEMNVITPCQFTKGARVNLDLFRAFIDGMIPFTKLPKSEQQGIARAVPGLELEET